MSGGWDFSGIFSKFNIVDEMSIELAKESVIAGFVTPGTFQMNGTFRIPLYGQGPFKIIP
jgi:hypothetical protein